MTKENIKKLHEHYSKLIEDSAYRESFSMTLTDKGKVLNPSRSELIKSDAIKNKSELEKKHPFLVEQEKPKEEPKETKSKKVK